jgi:hypothetical protein
MNYRMLGYWRETTKCVWKELVGSEEKGLLDSGQGKEKRGEIEAEEKEREAGT